MGQMRLRNFVCPKFFPKIFCRKKYNFYICIVGMSLTNMKEKESIILSYLNQMASMKWEPKQAAWFKKKAKDAHLIEMSSMFDKFSKEEISQMKKSIRFKRNECYRNVSLFAQNLMARKEKVEYVEGLVSVCGCPLEHAWVKIGNQYFDPTLELLLKDNVKEKEYVALGSWEMSDVWEVQLKTGYYGEIYREKYIETLQH